MSITEYEKSKNENDKYNIEQEEYINEEENQLKEYGCEACLEQYYDGKNKCRNCDFDFNIFNKIDDKMM